MRLANYHCHSRFCDGEGSLEDYAEAARERGLSALGFSAHAPLPFPSPWCLGGGIRPSALGEYRAAVEALRRREGKRLAIWSGLEVDFIPGLIGPADAAFAGFDYRIGSVHFLSLGRGEAPWAMDEGREAFDLGLASRFGGSARSLAAAYYGAVREMLRSSPPDIVGHLDLVKKYNRGDRLFSEDEPWYRREVEATLRAIAKAGALVEVNTGGMARGWTEEPYPSPWILERCSALGISLTLSSDCHRPEDLDFAYAEALDAIGEAGYRSLAFLSEKGWAEARINAILIEA
jgi:histidinol-phosphatase (PHP family)